ncbi:hypothetical protein ACCO45_003547 [Purpureocillium lilacinum]|uniref:Uncharacterized protein n=1 Tax=Purpureocillium lilacinum TaxID=33203 RepID=A0ACC4E2P3_PURLI
MGGHAPGRRAKFRIPPIGASEDGLRSSPSRLRVVREHSKVRGPAAARPCLRLRDSQGSGELCQGRANGSGLPVSILQRFARQYDGLVACALALAFALALSVPCVLVIARHDAQPLPRRQPSCPAAHIFIPSNDRHLDVLDPAAVCHGHPRRPSCNRPAASPVAADAPRPAPSPVRSHPRRRPEPQPAVAHLAAASRPPARLLSHARSRRQQPLAAPRPRQQRCHAAPIHHLSAVAASAKRSGLKKPVFSHGHLTLQQIIRDGPNDGDFVGALESARWKVIDEGIKSAEDGMVRASNRRHIIVIAAC